MTIGLYHDGVLRSRKLSIKLPSSIRLFLNLLRSKTKTTNQTSTVIVSATFLVWYIFKISPTWFWPCTAYITYDYSHYLYNSEDKLQ